MNNASIHDAIIKYLFETKWFDAQFLVLSFWCYPWSTTHRVLKSHRSNMNAIYMLIYIYIYIYYIHTYYFISHIYIYTYTWELQARPHRRRGCHPHTYFSRTFPVKIRFCVILQGTQLAPALPESRRWA